MNSKNPGEGLRILLEVITKGIEYRWASLKELVKEIWSMTDDNKHDWMSRREDYRIGKHYDGCWDKNCKSCKGE